MRKCLLVILSLMIYMETTAQKKAVSDSTTYKKHSMLALPVVYYSPETKFAFGALAYNLFKPHPLDSLAQTSYVRTAFIYTLNNQYLLEVDNQIFFRDDRRRMKNYFLLRSYPDSFYGIGQDIVPEEDRDLIKFFDLTFRSSYLFQLFDNMYLGARYQYYDAMDIEKPEENLLDTNDHLGKDGYRTSGLGIAFQWDTRNNILNASSGYFIELESEHNFKAIGSTYRYDWMRLDMRYYKRVNKSGVVATQFRGDFTSGDVPFESLAKLGDSRIMRGYFKGKYRDKVVMATQVEYRQHVWRRFGLVGFVGAGNIAPALDQFSTDQLKYNYGGGVRFMVKKKEELNIRIDYGIGNDDNSGFYVEISEAF